MKKTKLLTSIAALALVVSLGACEGDININIDGGVNIGGDSSSDTEDTETSEPTSEDTSTPDTEQDEPDEPLTEEELKTAQAIVDAAAAISGTGYNSFEYLSYDALIGEGGGALTHNSYKITRDSDRHIYGLRTVTDETNLVKKHYYIDGKDYYDYSYTSSNVTATSLTALISNNVGVGYNGAFDNAASLDVSLASGVALKTEENGNYKLTFTLNGVWYCYKATSSLALVGAGYYAGLDLGDYATTSGYEFYYGELTTAEAIEEAVSDFNISLWVPDTSEDTKTNAEKALEFIEAVDDKTQALTEISWDAFHYYDGEAGGLFNEEVSEEGWLTTQNGNLYGYIDEIDDGELEEYHTYYQNGVRFYDNDGTLSYTESYNETFDGLLDTQLDNAYEVFEVLEDAVEAAEEDDIVLTSTTSGTTLTITATTGDSDSYGGGTSATTTYVLGSDASYNLTKISSEKEEEDTYNGGAITATTTTKYLLEKQNVGQIALPADFDPADFGYTASGSQGEDGEATIADVIEVLNTIGGAYNYGDGFYYESIDYTLYGYTDMLINATNNGYGNYMQTDYNFAGDGVTVTYTDYMSIYTDGTNTYYYDEDGLETYPDMLLYTYDIYKMYANMYFAYSDYYEILDELEGWAERTDVYNDIELDDGSISFMGYNDDFDEMVMLLAAYDENGFEYFVYQYSTETAAYAVELYPETSVEVPSWLS